MKNIVFISDFFLKDGVHGGAEQFNENLLSLLSQKYKISRLNSHNATPDIIEAGKESFFIISNFMNLSEACKKLLFTKKYIILEHDHKYITNNDPSKFVNMIAPQNKIWNLEFFQKAQAVLCQSKIHAEVAQKNLLVNNIINLSCNLWSDEQLEFLSSFVGKEKVIKNSIIDSNNKNKGTPSAIKYCQDNNIEFNRIGWLEYPQFLEQLAKTETLIFFPQWLESFNRLVVEAKILGCKITTNKLVGVASEEWFRNAKPEDIIPILKEKREHVLKIFETLIEEKEHNLLIPEIKIPKVSIITSLYKGGKFIKRFMENITSQTCFDKCELIILDANSPDKEYETTIKGYLDEYNNIKYKRLKDRKSVQETMNLGLGLATGEILTIASVDDFRHPEHIRTLSSALVVDSTVDLVYADCYQSSELAAKFEECDKNNKYEHSMFKFTKENMIKCLPGPMPVWRRSVHTKTGNFDEKYKYAGDWDMWLRMVREGSKFKKIEQGLGIYYFNPEGLSTSADNHREKFKEEREVFNKNKDIFGDRITNMFEGYFNGR